MWKKFVNKLVEECTKATDEVKIAGTALLERRNECQFSCAIYVVLIAIKLVKNIEKALQRD